MLFPHEGYVHNNSIHKNLKTRSAWKLSLGNILTILVDDFLDLSWYLQNSVNFFEENQFVYFPTFRGVAEASSYQTNFNENQQKPHLWTKYPQKMNKLINNAPLWYRILQLWEYQVWIWKHPYLWQSFNEFIPCAQI